jgi:hypothetical protein
MRDEDILDYHRRRAMRELDLGLMAASPNVARAHLTLSSLHLERLRQAGGEQGKAPLLRM